MHELLGKLVPVLYEDARLLAVAKPAGVEVGGQAGGRQGGHTGGRHAGLAEWLATGDARGSTLYVANRLSRDESGVLILGKDTDIVRHIRTGLKTGRIAQEYLAVVRGPMHKPRVQIEPGGGASRGRRETKPRKQSTKQKPEPTILLRRETGDRRALVTCRTVADTTHMLRAQLRSVSLPVVGDQEWSATAAGGVGSPNRKRPPARSQQAAYLHLAKIAFHHPDLKRKLTLTAPMPGGFLEAVAEKPDPMRAVAGALIRRISYLADADTNAYRLLVRDKESVRGLSADRFGCVAVLQVFEDKRWSQRALRPVGQWYKNTLGLDAVYVKRMVKARPHDRSGPAFDPRSPDPLVGKPVPRRLDIHEGGVRYLIQPYDGLSTGLFLDQRENRRRVRETAADKDVLNLFAYTCGFSVAAAAGDARSTVSVDIAKKHLEWGKANFALNGFGLDNHRFICSDATDYFKRANRRGESFDMIIMDPPSFAHGRARGRSFELKRDLQPLIRSALSILKPGGVMLISMNHRELSAAWLRRQVGEASRGRDHRVKATPPLPPDFAPDPDHAKSMFVRFA